MKEIIKRKPLTKREHEIVHITFPENKMRKTDIQFNILHLIYFIIIIYISLAFNADGSPSTSPTSALFARPSA